MPSSRRRSRRRRRAAGAAGEGAPVAPASAAQRVVRPLPEWRWRTFPVYFAFSLGSFVGLYLGLIVAATGEGWLVTAVFVAVAVMLGLGLSRLTTRWVVGRRWARARPKRP